MFFCRVFSGKIKVMMNFLMHIKSNHFLLGKCLGAGDMHEILGSAETHLGLFSLQAVILLGHGVAMTWKHSLYEIV